MLSTMKVILVLSLLGLSTSAEIQWLEYMDIANAYGGVDFLITSDTYYPASWQRVNGDPHGQVAEEEKPDPLGDETLSFDFPDTGTHTLLLWSHSNLGVDIHGEVTDKRLLWLDVIHDDFTVMFRDTQIHFGNHAAQHYGDYDYTGTFDYTLNSQLEASIRSVDDDPPAHKAVELLFGGYLFRIIAPQGVYNVSGKTEGAMSITLWKGNHLQMEALMGQIDGYTIYAGNKTLGDYALAVPKIYGRDKDPVLVQKTHHLGRYKTCWHYSYTDKSKPHGIIGDFTDFDFNYTPA